MMESWETGVGRGADNWLQSRALVDTTRKAAAGSLWRSSATESAQGCRRLASDISSTPY